MHGDAIDRRGADGEKAEPAHAGRLLRCGRDDAQADTADDGQAHVVDIEPDRAPPVALAGDPDLGQQAPRDPSPPSCHSRKVSVSATSSARLLTGLPTPCPARPSWKKRMGCSSCPPASCCSSAAIL